MIFKFSLFSLLTLLLSCGEGPHNSPDKSDAPFIYSHSEREDYDLERQKYLCDNFVHELCPVNTGLSQEQMLEHICSWTASCTDDPLRFNDCKESFLTRYDTDELEMIIPATYILSKEDGDKCEIFID